MLPVFNPMTGTIIDHVPALTDQDIARAVDAAVEGQKEWAAKPQTERNRILRKFAEIVLSRRKRSERCSVRKMENGSWRRRRKLIR